MTTKEMFLDHEIQCDASGQGHSWQKVTADVLREGIAEEITCWIVDEDPEPGSVYTASNGLRYRVKP